MSRVALYYVPSVLLTVLLIAPTSIASHKGDDLEDKYEEGSCSERAIWWLEKAGRTEGERSIRAATISSAYSSMEQASIDCSEVELPAKEVVTSGVGAFAILLVLVSVVAVLQRGF